MISGSKLMNMMLNELRCFCFDGAAYAKIPDELFGNTKGKTYVRIKQFRKNVKNTHKIELFNDKMKIERDIIQTFKKVEG